MKGIKDLLEQQRWQTKHIMEKLESSGIRGKWTIHQNIYNLVDGLHRPKDPAVYIVLARMLNVTIEDIIYRYSESDIEEGDGYPASQDVSEENVNLKNENLNW